jgi:hypothetical protein
VSAVDAATKKKRLGRGSIRALAVASGAVAFALPWVAVKYAPAATTASAAAGPKVIVVPAGSSVVVAKGARGVKIVKSTGTAPVTAGAASPATQTTTGGSVPLVH